MTVVEFALVVPIFLGMLMFVFDLGHYLYVRSVLAGEINAAGRSSTLETATDATRAAMDARIESQVQRIVPNGDLEFTYIAYRSYGGAQNRAEAFNDTGGGASSGNGVCDNNELYIDANGNGQWDADAGVRGGGNANDVVIYTANLTYNRWFPLAGLLGWNPQARLTASTILRNQPFGTQAEPQELHCSS
ncbi:TadE/TadG family type IV pilus assembly protein [Altererythrobacter sp. Root672]|uniref:TadE/TadG family type IV pilus assembly protein n=1 Tax=Altererythrobacter sp. Root672 TaxID=1736584 RepID=UPI001F290601|nr:TadE/TadG family type IV pilus assembly protein [Altererythrobacter sp. Root672]